ncbi:Xaa-His dipeptidase [Streptococcus infantarius subsp. infantarius]|nr:Xaa-His dipeptidase [Streptococcus infantarius subsp. infantarius]
MPDWKKIIDLYKENLLTDLDGLLRIPSVKDPKTASVEAPFGKAIQKALDYMLKLGQRDGFKGKDIDHYAAHLEIGQGKKLLGILSHLDVVPADESQWDNPPFIPIIKDGKLFARGALDDKGPTLLAYYAVKILQDCGYRWNHRLRLIYGTDEENNWEGINYYFQKEEMPDYGIVPDGIFPMIYAEKGVASIKLSTNYSSKDLLYFASGYAYNVVPDYAKAVLNSSTSLETDFQNFLSKEELRGTFKQDNNQICLEVFGQSAHAAGPDKGLNAGLHLIHFLTQLKLDEGATDFIRFIDKHLYNDFKGEQLKLAFDDTELGSTTLNTALIHFENGNATVGINFRYPASYPFKNRYQHLMELLADHNFSSSLISHQLPSQSNVNDPEAKILLEAYHKHTDDQTVPLAIGGLTYARVFKRGVTFGPAFLGKPATLHQPNEYIELEDLFKGLEIYLDALYQLATVEGQRDSL